jgi:hypothetical protein
MYYSYKEAKRSIPLKQISKIIEKKDIGINKYNILCGKIINEDLKGANIEFDRSV